MTDAYVAYVDDSGSDGVDDLFTAVVLVARLWTQVLSRWKSLRQEFRDGPAGLPTHFELHTSPFLKQQPLKELAKRVKRRRAILDATDPDAALNAAKHALAQLELADAALTASIHAALAAGKTSYEVAAATRMNVSEINERLDVEAELERLKDVPCLRDAPFARKMRRDIIDRCVTHLAGASGMTLMTAHCPERTKASKERTYQALLAALDGWLVQREGWATVVVDGTPSARTLFYRRAHRGLDIATRHILEDEVVRDSSESHFIQMADIAAYMAFEAVGGERDRYLQLADLIHSSSGHPPDEEDLGLFTVQAEP